MRQKAQFWAKIKQNYLFLFKTWPKPSGYKQKTPALWGGSISSRNPKKLCGSRFGFIYQNLTSVVQFSFVPVGSVEQVYFASSWVFSQCWGYSLIMSSSFVSSGFWGLSLGMCHDYSFLSLIKFFNASHLGSVLSSLPASGSLTSLTLNFSSSSMASFCNVPSSTPGWTRFWGTANTTIS